MGFELLNATSASNSAFRVACGELKIPNDILFHSEAVFAYVKSGHTVIEVGGATESLSEGDIYFITPNQKYKLLKKTASIDIVSLNFTNPSSITQDYIPQNIMRSLLNGNCTRYALVKPGQNSYIKMKNAFYDVIRAEKDKEDYFQLIVYSKMYELFYILFSEKLIEVTGAAHRSKKYRALMRVTDYIDENYATGVSLEDVSEATGISRYYISHLFKELMNTTFINYVNQLRLNCATTLLLTTDYAIIDIASMSGFNNLSNFNRVFKLNFNKTPSAFRKTV